MNKTTVVHCKKHAHDVYIGRPSIFGNPYSHKMDTLAQFRVYTRDQAVASYRHYATERMKNDPTFAAAVKSLRGKVLGCWCKPQSCHGDILAELADSVAI